MGIFVITASDVEIKCAAGVCLQVKVVVLDINDNTPMFSQSQYLAEVSEGLAPGSEVLTVTATDLDEDKHLFFTIHSVTSPASNNKFKINSVSGTFSHHRPACQ